MTTFTGFEPANTTPVPDTLFDVLLSKLSGAELKVMLYIIRRTLGFKKTNDTISFTQFEKGIITSEGKVLDEGTGLSRETINKALQSLEAKGCIKSDKAFTPQRDKDTTLYSIRFSDGERVVRKSDHMGSQKSKLPVVGNSDYGSQKNRERVVRKSDLQETVLQDTDKQETVLQEERDVATATARSQSSPSQETSQDDETVKREAVKPQKDMTHGTIPNSAPGNPAMGNTRAASSSHAKRPDTNKVGTPPAPDKSQTNQITPTPHAKPVEPHADMAWGTRKCLQWFDYWRGGILIAKYKLMEASRCAKGLAEQFDEATVIQIRDRMAQDAFWMERGGPDVCDVANNIHKELKKKSAKPAGKNEKDGYRRISSFDDPNFTMEHEFYPSEREKREAAQAAQAAQQGVKA